jgi:hypothetical protein
VPDAPHFAPRTSHIAIPGRQWILLVCLFLISLPAVTARIYASDEVQYFSYLRSLWFDRDLSFDNEYRYFAERAVGQSVGFYETHLHMTTETGRRINFGTIGCAILWAPAYAIGDLTARALHAAGRDVPIDGYSKPYITAVAYASTCYGFAALLISMAAARRLGLNAFRATLFVWFGTPLLFYMYVAPPFSHACSAFAVALFTYVWLRVRERWSIRGVIALGMAGALMGMVREQDLFFIAGPAADFAWSAIAGVRRSWPDSARVIAGSTRLVATAAAGCLAFAATFTPQAIAYVRLNGHLGPSRLVARKMTWWSPHGLQVLFSPQHGFFVWTPLAIMAIAGLVWMAASAHGEDRARIARWMLLMAALQVFVAGSVESWTVAGAYGQRRFIALTPLLIVGYAAAESALAAGSRHARRAVTAVAVLCLYWNLGLMAEFATGLMDRQRLDPARNAYDAFVTIPRRAPDLAYRYLFDRSSFYRTNAPP